MFEFSPHDYGPKFSPLLMKLPLNQLGPGLPQQEVEPELLSLDLPTAFVGKKIVDSEMAQCCLSGLWLVYDYLDRSHTISQQIHSATGSYWHGIMHRREPDFSNSKYWYQRVGDHPIFDQLACSVREIASSGTVKHTLAAHAFQGSWDPFFFVDLCSESSDPKKPNHELCRRLAQTEWQLLFDFCYKASLG